MNSKNTSLSQLFSKWKIQKFSEENIMNELNMSGYNQEQQKEILMQYSNNNLESRLSKGWTLMGVGGFVGFLSCLLTMVDLFPEQREFCLYGLTTIGVSLAFYGSYLVLEKQ